jgi:hypothetical protein
MGQAWKENTKISLREINLKDEKLMKQVQNRLQRQALMLNFELPCY